MTISTADFNTILSTITTKTTLSKFLLSVIESPVPEHREAVGDVARNLGRIIDSLASNPFSNNDAMKWAHGYAVHHYASQISTLVKKSTGLQFHARTMTEERIHEFDIAAVAEKMMTVAPELWELMDTLLSGDEESNQRRKRAKGKRTEKTAAAVPGGHKRQVTKDGDVRMEGDNGDADESDSEAEYWDQLDEADDEYDEDRASERRQALKTIKKVVCISVMIHSSNQKCNALQSVVGIFLHSCETPDAAIEIFAHMGITISTTAINSAIRSLSKESAAAMRRLGRTFLTSYAYDNLDIDLKHSTPTLEKLGDTLIHLTTGTMLPLHSQITLSDLNCSEELWKTSRLNKSARAQDIPSVKFKDILNLHAEEDNHPSGLLRRDRFNAWKFLDDLVHFGPEYFRKFRKDLKEPEIIEQIPLEKIQQVPNRALDIPPSTPAQNAEALGEFFHQGGIGDPKEDEHASDITNFVILVFGDLLTGERLRSLLESRSEESTVWRRGQFIVYVMGLFHLKMACVDAIWRIFLMVKNARLDDSCLMNHAGEMRPKDTGKLGTGPGFRRMHEVIQHVGIVSRLDCWRLAVQRADPLWVSLEAFAQSGPTWDTLQRIANQLAVDSVAGSEMSETRAKPKKERDAHHENTLLRQKYFLLYEEISHAMNAGDIGRVETCFMPWTFIFQSCGKHKYASELMRYLENIHFVYPEGLKKAVRLSILCNPTGRKRKFRGIDWVVEHNNLYTKRIYGGRFSNRQKQRIITESPLIEVYKNTRIQFEKMFCLSQKSAHHSPPALEKTFKKLAMHMQKNNANTFQPGREALYKIPDAIADGMHVVLTKKVAKSNENPDWEDLDDDEPEVEDDGGLDL